MSAGTDRHPETGRFEGVLPVDVKVGAPLGPRGPGSPGPRRHGHLVEVARPATSLDEPQRCSTHHPGVVGLDAGVVPVIGRYVLEEASGPVDAQQTSAVDVPEADDVLLGEATTLVGEGNELEH